jgi:putative ABC transport system ATP-binding protein
MMGVAVELEGVSRRFPTGAGGSVTALEDVSFSIAAGDVVGITGPSGSGKSTLLYVVGAMDVPDQGRITVGNVLVERLSRSGQADYRRTIGFVFQQFHLLAALTVLDNVVAPLLPYRTEFDKFERARELLAAVGLEERADSLPSRLSGGQQQRVAIARALINDPGLLLADEPTGNLDSATGSEIMELMLELRRQRGMTVIVATHNPLIATRCDRILRLQDGRVAEDIKPHARGQPSDLLERITRFDPRT